MSNKFEAISNDINKMNDELINDNNHLENIDQTLDTVIENKGKYNMLLDSVSYKIKELKNL